MDSSDPGSAGDRISECSAQAQAQERVSPQALHEPEAPGPPAAPASRFLVLNGGYLVSVPSGGDRHLLGLGAALGACFPVDYVVPEVVAELVPDTVNPVTYRSALPESLGAMIGVYLLRMLRVARILRGCPADFVLTSPGLFDILPARLHCWWFGSRLVVFVFHLGNPGDSSARAGLQRWLSALAQRVSSRLWSSADLIVTSTDEVEEQLLLRGVPPERVRRQLPCVEVQAVERAPELPSPEVLFVGRLVRRKGVFDLVEAAAQHGFSVGFVGDGEEREELHRFVRRRGLESIVRVYGALPDEQVWGHLKGCACLVLPSYEEGYSLVIAEAIVAGKPVVAYALTHYDEVFPGAILQTPLGDVAALGEEVSAVLRGDRCEALEDCRRRRAAVRLETTISAARSLAGWLEADGTDGANA